MPERTGAIKTRTQNRAMVKFQPAPPPARVLTLGRVASVYGRVPAPIRKITYGSARFCALSLAGFVVIALIAVFEPAYAWVMKRRGVLR